MAARRVPRFPGALAAPAARILTGFFGQGLQGHRLAANFQKSFPGGAIAFPWNGENELFLRNEPRPQQIPDV